VTDRTHSLRCARRPFCLPRRPPLSKLTWKTTCTTYYCPTSLELNRSLVWLFPNSHQVGHPTGLTTVTLYFTNWHFTRRPPSRMSSSISSIYGSRLPKLYFVCQLKGCTLQRLFMCSAYLTSSPSEKFTSCAGTI
jgi:hypothetical protein